MDITKVVLKFKQNTKGTHTIAYCEEYPSIQGIGPDEGHATANFWKAYNIVEEKAEHDVTMSKKAELAATTSNSGKNKKKAA